MLHLCRSEKRRRIHASEAQFGFIGSGQVRDHSAHWLTEPPAHCSGLLRTWYETRPNVDPTGMRDCELGRQYTTQCLGQRARSTAPHGQIFAPVRSDDETELILLYILLTSPASMDTLRTAFAHLGVEVANKPRNIKGTVLGGL